ncbi:MAG: cobalamin biosynthesis protein [Deltaproteobacteria bacterium]
MSVAVIAITRLGLAVARKVSEGMGGDLFVPKEIQVAGNAGLNCYNTTTKELVARIWNRYDSFVFVMALGIVNRIIKDHIQDKRDDPAVVVVDEMGRYAISALSGHEGGANRLAEKVALVCGGDFVVTTGSEAARTLIVGMGCRRGVSADHLEETLIKGLGRIGRELNEVRLIASVEDKRDEKGLLELSERLNVPLKFIPKSLIKTVQENFTESELVKNTLGVGSVAEPCAMLGGFRCHLLLPKTKTKVATIAIAEERFL